MDALELILQSERHMAQVLRTRLADLGVAPGALRILKGRGVTTLGDLTSLTRADLEGMRFLGAANAEALERLLTSLDLTLKKEQTCNFSK